MSTAILITVLAIITLISCAWWFIYLNLRGRPSPLRLQAGDTLPAFPAEDESGNAVISTDLRGAATVLVFVRGNWCPFCNRQVADLTRHYKEITERAARLIFVTPKPLETTRRVADMFGVEFDFWLDPQLNAARQLGLVHVAGVPGKHRDNYGQDTIWPTAMVCDADGVIRYISQSKKIMDRPDPAVLVKELRKL